MGKTNLRSYLGIFIIGVFFITIYFVNRWFMKQMDQTMHEEVVSSDVVKITPVVDSRQGVPKIDPNNDPLAPVRTPEPFKELNKKQEVNEASESIKIYEMGSQNPILPQ